MGAGRVRLEQEKRGDGVTWEVFLGIVAIVGFGVTIATPIIKLNTSITKLNCSIDQLNEGMASSDKRITSHGKQIDALEKRVTVLETFHDGRDRGNGTTN